MSYSIDKLDLARQKIQHVEEMIAFQDKIIDSLRAMGKPTKLPERMMAKLRAGLEERQTQLAVIETDLIKRPDQGTAASV